jgi:hypothetical protein
MGIKTSSQAAAILSLYHALPLGSIKKDI